MVKLPAVSHAMQIHVDQKIAGICALFHWTDAHAKWRTV